MHGDAREKSRVVKNSTKLENRFSKASDFAKFKKPVFKANIFKNSAETGFHRFFNLSIQTELKLIVWLYKPEDRC